MKAITQGASGAAALAGHPGIALGIQAISGLTSLVGGLRGGKAGAGIGPLFSQLSGRDEQRAAQEEAGLLGRQSDLVFSESLRDAAQRQREVTKFKEQQSLDFSSSGVTLEGSPLGILEETRFLGQQEVSAIKNRGEALAGLLTGQGLQMLRRGSSAAFGGFANALQQKFTSGMGASLLKQQGIQTGLSGFGTGLQAFGLAQSYRKGGSGKSPGYAATGYNPITGKYPGSSFNLSDTF